MSVERVQEMLSMGNLIKAQTYLDEFSEGQHFEKNLYHSLILICKGDYQRAGDLAVEALDIAKLTQDNIKQAYGRVAIAYSLLKLGKLDEAKYYITNTEENFANYLINDDLDMAYWYQCLYQIKGSIHARFGEIKESLASFEKCLEITLKSDQKGPLAGIYNNLGYSNNLIGKSKIAYEYFLKSLEVAEELDNNFQMYYPLSNLGNYFYSQGNIENATKYHTRALDLAIIINNKANIASQYRDMSQIFRFKGEFEESLNYLQKSLELRNEIGNPIWSVFTLIYLVEICTDLNRFDLAMAYSDQIKEICKLNKNNKLIDQISRMADGLICKAKPRLKSKSEAMKIFREIIEEEMVDYDNTVNAILHLCDLLLFEIKLTSESEVLLEIHTLTAKLIQMAEANSSHTLIGEILGLQAGIAIIEDNFSHALNLYDKALQLAKTHKSLTLEKKIKQLRENFINESENWRILHEKNNGIIQKIEKSNVESYLKEIIKLKDNLFQK